MYFALGIIWYIHYFHTVCMFALLHFVHDHIVNIIVVYCALGKCTFSYCFGEVIKPGTMEMEMEMDMKIHSSLSFAVP